MAVRFDNSADYLSLSTDLPAVGQLTFCCWVNVITDRNAKSGVWAIRGAGGEYLTLSTNSTGTTLLFYWSDPEAGAGNYEVASLSTGAWYFVAHVINGANFASYAAQFFGTLTPLTGSANNDSWFTPTEMVLGNGSIVSEWLNGRVAYAKLWTAALTTEELANEMFIARPNRLENLYGFWPLLNGGGATERTSDYSHNGHTWTENGTLTNENQPPVSWGASPIFITTPPTTETVEVSLALATILTTAQGRQSNMFASPSALNRIVTAAPAGRQSTSKSLSLAKHLGVAPAPNPTFQRSVAMNRVLAAATQRGATRNVSVSLARSLAVTQSRRVTLVAGVDINKVLQLSGAAQRIVERQVALQRILLLVDAAEAQASTALTLSRTEAITTARLSTQQAALSLPLVRLVTSSGLGTVLAATTINKVLAAESNGFKAFSADLTMGMIRQLGISPQAAAFFALTLQTQRDIDTDRVAQAVASVTLSRVQRLSTQLQRTIGASLTLQRIQGVSEGAGRILYVNVALSARLQTASGRTGRKPVSTTLPVQHQIALLAAMFSEESIAIESLHSMNIFEEVIELEATIPLNRMFVVDIEERIGVVLSDARNGVVLSDERIFIVPNY